MRTDESSTEEEFDQIIEGGAFEHDMHHFKPAEPNELWAADPEEQKIRRMKRGNPARQSVPKPVDEAAVQAEAFTQEEEKYFAFKHALPGEITRLYQQLHCPEDDYANARQEFAIDIVLHRDGRKPVLERKTCLEDVVRNFAARETLGTPLPELLTPAEKQEYRTERQEYKRALAILNVGKALDNPEHPTEHLEEAKKVLKSRGNKALADSVDLVYCIVALYEKQI